MIKQTTTPMRGYYSLVQFCPDYSRMEVVNVGIVLFCPDNGFLQARMSPGNSRAKKLVKTGELKVAALTAAKNSLANRFVHDRQSFASVEDLNNFALTLGNELRLTEPRPVKVRTPSEDLERLFNELVEETRKVAAVEVFQEPHFPELDATFRELAIQSRATLDFEITVPILRRKLSVPYGYQNGVFNLVVTKEFSARDKTAMDSAMELAMEGDQVYKNGLKKPNDSRLIVVSSFNSDSDQSLIADVDSLLTQYQVRSVLPDTLGSFLHEVRTSAH